MSIPKRSTSGIINSVMNQPLYQQAILNAQNPGQDKRAVGSRNAVLGQAVRGERDRLLGMDIKGSELAMRKDKLGFARQIAAKKNAMAEEKMKIEKKSNSLAYTLGGLSTVASGFSGYSDWKKDKKADERWEEEMNIRQPHRQRAKRFNDEYFKNYDPGYK